MPVNHIAKSVANQPTNPDSDLESLKIGSSSGVDTSDTSDKLGLDEKSILYFCSLLMVWFYHFRF